MAQAAHGQLQKVTSCILCKPGSSFVKSFRSGCGTLFSCSERTGFVEFQQPELSWFDEGSASSPIGRVWRLISFGVSFWRAGVAGFHKQDRLAGLERQLWREGLGYAGACGREPLLR